MKAVVYENYGGLANLQIKSIVRPSPENDEVLVRVCAVSINDWDWGKMDGSSLFNRLLSGWRRPKHTILGSDIAGIIEGTGKDVTKFRIGDEVYGDLSGRWGGFAEYVCAPEASLVKKPPLMSFEQAASIPQAAMLAVQALIDIGHISNGKKILINGAGGGVGTFGLQIAGLYDVEVTVVDSADKLEMLSSLGAVKTVDYRTTDFTEMKEKYDLIVDVKTDRSVHRYLKVLKPQGMYVTVGGSLSLLLGALILMPFIKVFTGKKVGIVVLKPNKDLGYISQLYYDGKLKPVIDGPYPLESIREAFRVFGDGKHKGKIVITVP